MQKTFINDKSNRELCILFLSIITGGFVGFYFPHFMTSIAWIGKVFMNYLMLLVLPLIFFALVTAITSIGDINKLGKLGKYSRVC